VSTVEINTVVVIDITVAPVFIPMGNDPDLFYEQHVELAALAILTNCGMRG
jgi:hypothetical protein